MYRSEWYDGRGKRHTFETADKWAFVRHVAAREVGDRCQVQILVASDRVTLTFRFPGEDVWADSDDAVDRAIEEVCHECHGFGLVDPYEGHYEDKGDAEVYVRVLRLKTPGEDHGRGSSVTASRSDSALSSGVDVQDRVEGVQDDR